MARALASWRCWAAAGFSREQLTLSLGKGKIKDMQDEAKAWRDVWSAGHGVATIHDIPTVAELVAQGFDRDTVKKVEHLIFISEYKRFQSAPGARLTMRSFWLDRRYPIVNRWRDPS